MAISRLTIGNDHDYASLLQLFAEAFNDAASFTSRKPSPAYIARILGNQNIIMLVNREGETITGGLFAYVLEKFEQERSEIYIYDLAVKAGHRRRGIATQLIQELRRIGQKMGAYVIFVQADKGQEDIPAIALYTKLGIQEDVFHFDIKV